MLPNSWSNTQVCGLTPFFWVFGAASFRKSCNTQPSSLPASVLRWLQFHFSDHSDPSSPCLRPQHSDPGRPYPWMTLVRVSQSYGAHCNKDHCRAMTNSTLWTVGFGGYGTARLVLVTFWATALKSPVNFSLPRLLNLNWVFGHPASGTGNLTAQPEATTQF